MDMTLAEFLKQIDAARRVDSHQWPELKVEEWLWDAYCFDDTMARHVSVFGKQCFTETERLDIELHRLFHGGSLH